MLKRQGPQLKPAPHRQARSHVPIVSMTWLFAAAFFPALQVLPLYLWPHLPRAATVSRRMAATTLAAAALGWRPTRGRLAAGGGGGVSTQVQRCSLGAALLLMPGCLACCSSLCTLQTALRVAAAWWASNRSTPAITRLLIVPHPAQTLLAALGLRSSGLLAASALPLLLTAVLFAGPLLQLATDRRQRHARLALPLPMLLRNLVVAPLVEEFVFRSCMLSYLLASGVGPTAAVALSPLLFAASHLHHVYDLTRFQGHSLRSALAAVAFQFSYTALFGWLAAWLFVRSRHLAAVALPHAFCNFMGPPLPPAPAAPGRSRILAAYGLGVAGFALLLRPLSDPRLYAIDGVQLSG